MSADRLVTLRIDRHPVRVMAIDGQPAEPFLAREGRITLAPGNRVDLFVDACWSRQHRADRRRTTPRRAARRRCRRARTEPSRAAPPTAPSGWIFAARCAPNSTSSAVNDECAGEAAVLGQARPHRACSRSASRRDRGAVLHIHGHHVRLLDALDDGWKPFWLDTILVRAASGLRASPSSPTIPASGCCTAAQIGAWRAVYGVVRSQLEVSNKPPIDPAAAPRADPPRSARVRPRCRPRRAARRRRRPPRRPACPAPAGRRSCRPARRRSRRSRARAARSR